MKLLLALLVAVIVVVAAAVAFALAQHHEEPLPPLHGQGMFRIAPAATQNGGQRPATVISRAGKRFTIALGMVSGDGADAKANMLVTGPGRDLPLAWYHAGQSLAFDGARLEVVAVHQRRHDADDRVDVRITVP